MKSVYAFSLRDGYQTHVRTWGDRAAQDVFVALHGMLSHSAVWERLGKLFIDRKRARLVAFDRRGNGLCVQNRGDFGGTDQAVDDVIEIAEEAKRSGRRVHLLPWCGAAPFAIFAAHRRPDLFSSLTFLAPVFGQSLTAAAAEEFRVILAAAEGKPDDELIEGPPFWSRFANEEDVPELTADEHILRRVTKRLIFGFGGAVEEALKVTSSLKLPQSAVFATRDSIADPTLARRTAAKWIPENALHDLDAPHALWYSAGQQVVELVERVL